MEPAVMPWLGGLYTLLVLVFCFLAVHVFQLARLGNRARKNLPPENPKPEEPKPEPVYYIVEKKKRARSTYSKPKRISFDK